MYESWKDVLPTIPLEGLFWFGEGRYGEGEKLKKKVTGPPQLTKK